MPGFFIANCAVSRIYDYDDSRCLYGEIKYKEWTIQRNTLNKFADDKVFAEFDDCIIVLDGIILNKSEIEEEFVSDNWPETVHRIYQEDETFFTVFRGCFAGAVYNKKQEKWIAFTDQVTNHSVFTYSESGKVAIGTRINYFAEWMRENHIPRILETRWLNDFFYHGYVMDMHSIIHSVNRVFPGSYVVIVSPDYSVKEDVYYKIVKTNEQATDEEWIEKLEKTFQAAVDRIQRKCEEYNYTMLLDISGGLDSRMIAAHVKPRNVMGICFAESGSRDQLVAAEVARTLSIPLLQLYLDGGKCLCEIDEFVAMNQGMSYYTGISGGKQMLEMLNERKIGIEANGLLGDIFEGAMITDENLDELKWGYDRFRVTGRFSDIEYKGYERDYGDNELLWFYCRGIIVGQNTHFIRQNYCEGISPYGDVDFMNLIYSIPYEKRTKGKLYRRWMMKKYPELAEIRYAGTGIHVTTSDFGEHFSYYLHKAQKRLKKLMGKDVARTDSMTPVDYWYEHGKDLKETLNRYYKDNLGILDDCAEVKSRVEKLFASADSSVMEKILAVTMISAIKQYIVQ